MLIDEKLTHVSESKQSRIDPDSARSDRSGNLPSDELLILGRITGHFGVKGWVKVMSYTRPQDEILDYETWWVFGGPEKTKRVDLSRNRIRGRALEITAFNSASKRIVVKFSDVNSREQAEVLIGCEVGVLVSQLPKLADGEYYWTQLTGLSVINCEGERLGTIKEIVETGANDVMVIWDDHLKLERLIPWSEQFVERVDLEGARIVVDWDAGWDTEG